MTTLPVAPPVEEEFEEQVPEHRGFVAQLLQNRKFMVGLVIFLALTVAALLMNLLTAPALRSTGSFLPGCRPAQRRGLAPIPWGAALPCNWARRSPNRYKLG